MDHFTLLVEVVKALAWPISTLVIILILRKPMPRARGGAQAVPPEVRGVEAQFEQAKQGVQKNLDAEAAAKALPPGRKPSPPQLEEAIASSPTAVVVTAWADMESTVHDMATKVGITGPIPAMVRELHKRGLVTVGTLNAIEGLRQMRNLVVHAPNGAASLVRANEFATMAEAMAWTIEQELGKARLPPADRT